MKIYDLIIIGGGIAGLTSAIYGARYNLDTLVISKEIGGTTATAHKICNFPSYFEISGFELMKKVREQVEKLNVPIIFDEVTKITKNKEIFLIKTQNKEYSAKKVIYAPGNIRKKLEIKGEMDFYGKGISYCAVCDGGFFKDKTVAVVGGGNSALTAAILLAERSKKVYILYRKSEFFRAEPAWVKIVKENPKIEVLFDQEVLEASGSKKLESLKLKGDKELKVDGLFIEIGSSPDLKLVQDLKLQLNKGYISVDKNQETSLKGLYAAGDVTDFEFKQAIVSASQGAVSTRAAYDSLKKGE